ncbi:MAG: peptide chain release factor N(5)-glutamine methyltransferase [Vampirovibrionales bacterium]|nr:peptide chain release factor N(5)-glutamine methyltransferase [Vampirovibrionales bacterium]
MIRRCRKSVHRFIQRALGHLAMPSAQRQAETAILLECAGLSFEDVFKDPDASIHPERWATVRELLRRRLRDRVPVQYLAGKAGFYGLTLNVTPDTLIPRPETELLVEAALGFLQTRRGVSACDIGVGSGAIILALADRLRERPDLAFFASDVCPRALAVARHNARALSLTERITFAEGDLLSPFAGWRFDLIVSNPPYIDPALKPTLADEVTAHEPSLALFASEDGYDLYGRLLAQAPGFLTRGGALMIELGDGMRDGVLSLARRHGFGQTACLKDLSGHDRVLSLGVDDKD